jgi:amino acid transporter
MQLLHRYPFQLLLKHITNPYLGIPVFACLYFGYKITYRTKIIPADKVDLTTGLREIDEAEQRFIMAEKAEGPQSFAGRLWDSL